MNNLKNIAYFLLVIISLSLISVSAQAGGISIRLGGYGHGYHVAYNSYYPQAYYGYHRPVVRYRHHYRPYYSRYGNNNHRSNHHSGHHQSYIAHNKYSSGHNSNHGKQAVRGYSRTASFRNHR